MKIKGVSSSVRINSLVWAIGTITASFCNTAFAQNNNPNIEEISVTGTRIRATDGMATPTPVTVITPAELASFEPGASVAEQLDALPQFFATQTAQRGGLALSGDAGASFLNMRSLGTNRTLVLLDSARMAPADKRGSVNVDTFPTALVRTVDVVTGGASAAYGADALGGVTNFIIDRDFEGFKVSTGTGLLEFGDGFRWNASVAGGKQFGDLHVIASFDAKRIKQINRDPEDLDADDYRRWGLVANPAYVSATATPNEPQRITVPWIAPTDRHVYGMISGTGTPLDGMVFNREGTAVRNFVPGDYYSNSGTINTRTTSGGPEAEIAKRAYGGPGNGAEVINRALFVAAKYEFSDSLSAYVQLVKGTSESNQTPNRADISGINMTSIWAPRIASDNAYLPASVKQALDAAGVKEFVLSREGAFIDEADMGIDQRDRNIFSTETWTAGFSWDLPYEWNLSGSYSTGETERNSSVENMMRIDRMFLAMDAVRDPNTGAIVCRVQSVNPTVEQLRAAGLASGLTNSRTQADPNPLPLESPIGLDNTIRDCVPYNVFGFGNISRQAIEYVGTDKYSKGIVEQDFAEVVATGEVYEGWGYGPISAAAGVTWRDSSFADGAFPVDIDALGPPINVPELGIRGIAPGYAGGSPNLHQFSTVPLIDGQFKVWEWFTEVQVPVWESASGNQSLGGSVAFRRSDYNLSGTSDSWKIGLEAQVFEGLRFRATKSRDVREASFAERFDAQGGGGNVLDRFRNDQNTSITVVASGNPTLAPEVADTLVAGVVYQPTWRWLNGLSISSDWYEVEIQDSISQIAQQDVVDRCFFGDTQQCDNIIRSEATGEITSVFRRYFNQAQATVEGIDLEVGYRMEPDFIGNEEESISVRFLAGYLLERKDIAANGTVTDLTGPASLPDLTANVTTNYRFGPWGVQLQGRFVDSGKLMRTWDEGVQVDDNTIASSTWWNGQLNYNGELESGATWKVGLAVQNLFDRAPPRQPGTNGGSTVELWNNQYDTFGRRYNLSFDMTF
jgi:iron complex outermembrane receptor protein